MQLSLFELLLFPAGIAAGTVNVLAGGGSFLTLPVLMAAGLPVEVANGSNRVSVVLQGLFASYDYHKKGALDLRLYRRFLPTLLAGSLIGAYLATVIDPDGLRQLFGALFLGMALFLLWQRHNKKRRAHIQKELLEKEMALAAHQQSALASPAVTSNASPLQISQALGLHPLRYPAMFLVGMYGGFIQAGVGLWILLTASALFGEDTVRVNSVKLPLTLTFTLPALLLFMQADLVRWIPGLILALGTIVGSAIGVRLSLKGGTRLIMNAVTLLLLITGLHLLFVRP